MFNKVRTILSFLLVFCISVSLIACSKTETTNDKTTQGTTSVAETTIEENLLAKKIEIKWFVNGGADIKDGNTLQKRIEDKFNVKIINVAEDMHNTEKMNLLISSGEMPDAGFMYQDANTLWDQGVLRAIPGDFIKKYAPGEAELLNKHPEGWLIGTVPGEKDKYKFLSGISVFGTGEHNAHMSYFRLDWLEKLGISPKGDTTKLGDRLWWTDKPFTLDELQQIMDGFVNKDPDGNGKKDTYGMTGTKFDLLPDAWGYFAFGSIMTAFKVFPRVNAMENGELKLWHTTNNYKEFLKYMANLYKKGYLDPEWTTLDFGKWEEKQMAGQAGFISTEAAYLYPYYDRAPHGILKRNITAKILVTPPIEGPDKKFNIPKPEATTLAYTFFIGSQVDDEKLARILQIYDWVNFDKEAKFTFYYGEEGKHWTWEGEPYNSAVVPGVVTPEEKGAYGINLYKHPIYDENFGMSFVVASYKPIFDWIGSDIVQKNNIFSPYRLDLFNETKYTELDKQYGSELSTISHEFYMRAINGELDIDNEWDNYIKRLKDAGMDKLVDELKKAPLVEFLRKGEIKY